MGLRLYALNLWLRFRVKTALKRMKEPREMRDALERDADRFFVTPDGTNFVDDLMRRDRPGTAQSPMEAVWVSCGRPDRRKVILYLHGGAYIAGSPRTHRHLAAALAQQAGVRAVLPDYRLAPEHPFPAALDDAFSAYCHLLNAGYGPHEVAFAGDSAGGGLVFALLLRLQTEGMAQPACAVGFSPWVDLTGRADSLRRNAARDVMLPAERMDEVVGFYLNGHAPTDPLASPVLGDWQSPPPALIAASTHEILRDDARTLAEVLRKAGGDTRLELWRNLPHAWPIFTGRLPEADSSLASAGTFIARHLAVESQD